MEVFENEIKKAIIAFEKKTGEYPTAESGDASKYFHSPVKEVVHGN